MNKLVAGLLLAMASVGPASAQHHPADHAAHPASAAPSQPMIEGEVRKVDREAKRVTIHHGEIKHLGMPPMTMVFQVRDPALLAKVKAGDKVRFRGQSDAGGQVLNALEVVK